MPKKTKEDEVDDDPERYWRFGYLAAGGLLMIAVDHTHKAEELPLVPLHWCFCCVRRQNVREERVA